MNELKELIAAVARGKRQKYVFFWGHRPRQKGVIDKSCLSNWYPSPFHSGGTQYFTAEQFIMAKKAALFSDEKAKEAILNARSPQEAKQWGRKVQNFDDSTWASHRFTIATDGLYCKFSQNEEMREFLLGTRTKILVEASPYDRVWGIGMNATDEQAGNPKLWRGLNLLGFSLMAVRERLSQ